MEERLLILDIGSSSIRAGLYTTGAEPCGPPVRRSQRWHRDEEDQAVLGPLEVLEGVSNAIDEVLAGLGAQERIVAVGISTLVGNLVGLDGAGNAVTPLYSYADTRSHAEAEELKAALGEALAETVERTGCPLHPAYWPAQLLHLAKTQPERFGRAHSWTDLASYLYGRWLAKQVPMSVSTASWSGLLDRARLVWDESLLRRLPLEASKLPRLADSSAAPSGLAKGWAERWPSLAKADFHLALGDGAAANLGSAGLSSEALVITIGSTSAARVIEPGCPRRPAGLWAYRVNRDYSLLGGALSEGGGSFAWLRERLVLPKPEALELALQNQEPAAHGLVVLPFLTGERAPGWQARATAEVMGLKQHTTNIDLVQAWLEAIGYRLALVVEGLPYRAAVVANGGALSASKAWQQILADILQKPLYLAREEETSARGVAYLVARYHGHEPRPNTLAAPILPRPAHAEVHERARQTQERLYLERYSQQPDV
jgi:gluconokinase